MPNLGGGPIDLQHPLFCSQRSHRTFAEKQDLYLMYKADKDFQNLTKEFSHQTFNAFI